MYHLYIFLSYMLVMVLMMVLVMHLDYLLVMMMEFVMDLLMDYLLVGLELGDKLGISVGDGESCGVGWCVGIGVGPGVGRIWWNIQKLTNNKIKLENFNFMLKRQATSLVTFDVELHASFSTEFSFLWSITDNIINFNVFH